MNKRPKNFEAFLSNEWPHFLLKIELLKQSVSNNTKLTYLVLGAVVAAAISRAVF